MENQGISWVDDNGKVTDALQLLKDKGVDSVRIRAFVNPDGSFQWTKPTGVTCLLGYADTQGVLYTAKRAQEMGMKIDLVIHYSDYFADPLYQDVPAQWKNATASELEKYVYDYTYYLMNELKQQGTVPEWVEVGNEINGGILYPYGSATDNMEQLTGYLNSGYDAVKAVSPTSKVVTHLANIGGGVSDFTWFFDQFLNQYGGKTDVIGMSYYPYWLGSNNIESLTESFYELADKYDKELMICEPGGDEAKPEETSKLLQEEISALKVIPNEKGIAVFYWEPEGNSSLLPDSYTLGATEVVGENTLHFTSALNTYQNAAEFLNNETTFAIENYSSKKTLNVAGGSTENETNIEQYEYGKWNSQKWSFEKVDDEYYKIVNKNSGKVLEVSNMSMQNNAVCKQYDDNGGWNQQWKIIETDNHSYMIQNRLSGLYLGIRDDSKDDGASCVQLNSNSDNTKWYFLVTE